jgi:hypothetical protein
MIKDLRNLSLGRIFLLLKIRNPLCGTPLISQSLPKMTMPEFQQNCGIKEYGS